MLTVGQLLIPGQLPEELFLTEVKSQERNDSAQNKIHPGHEVLLLHEQFHVRLFQEKVQHPLLDSGTGNRKVKSHTHKVILPEDHYEPKISNHVNRTFKTRPQILTGLNLEKVTDHTEVQSWVGLFPNLNQADHGKATLPAGKSKAEIIQAKGHPLEEKESYLHPAQ